MTEILGVSCEQAYLSTKQSAPRENPWLSSSNEDPCRSGDFGCQTAQGPHRAKRLAGRGWMLARANRITKAAEFRLVLNSGSRAIGQCLAVYCYQPEGPELLSTRVGLVVGKACGSAVVRNQIKRRLRSLARDVLPELPHGLLFVIRALPKSSQVDFDSLRGEFVTSLDRALQKVDRKTIRVQRP